MEVFVLQVASAKVWENKIALSKPPHSEHAFSVLFNIHWLHTLSQYMSHHYPIKVPFLHVGPILIFIVNAKPQRRFFQKTPANASTLGISHETQWTIAWPLALCAICASANLILFLFPYDSRCLVWGCICLFISSDLHCPMVFWAHQVALQHPVEKPEVIGHSFRRLPSLAVVN